MPIQPQINVSLFSRKKKLTEDLPIEEAPVELVAAAHEILSTSAEIAELAVNRIAWKLFVGTVVGGAILIATHTAGVILTNALDHHTSN